MGDLLPIRPARKTHLQRIDAWLRRKLRCFRLKQGRRSKAIADFLKSRGVPACQGRLLAGSSRGWWRKSNSPQAATAMTLVWFNQQGLVSLAGRYLALQTKGNRRGT